MKLQGRIDLGNVPAVRIERKAILGDLAVVRLENADYEYRFVIGTVAAIKDSGQVQAVSTARRRRAWRYGYQVHVADQHKLRGLSANRIASALPGAFSCFDDARAAVLDLLEQQEQAA